jgi:membrane-associated phospholipid phosphatase
MGLLTMPVWLGLFEPTLFYFMNRHLAVIPDQVWSLLCLLGTAWCIFALTAPLLLRAPRVFMAWLCAAPVAGAFARIGKMVPDNPRPLEVLGMQSIHVIGEPVYIAAMPSGHTLAAFAVATAIYFSTDAKSRPRAAWLFLLALGVGLSRLAVGAHWPADVAAGAALGVFSGMVGAKLAQAIPARHLQAQSWVMRCVALFGLVVLYVLVTDSMGFEANRYWQYALSAFLTFHFASFLRQSVWGSNPNRTTG